MIQKLEIMLKDDEISNNESMFLFLNIIDVAENKKLVNCKNKFAKYGQFNYYQYNSLECFHRKPYTCS